ncbi:retrotransposon gag domain, retroviral aspartyl protease, partial [Tanacetum coccineum]
MDKAKSLSTLMVGRSLKVDNESFRPCEEDEDNLGREVPYLSAIGALIYLTNCTRPNISFAVNLLARFSLIGYLSDPHKARSQNGYVFLNGGTAISWRSQKQTLVATSSNHAEVIALHEANRECVWLRSMTQLIVTSYGLSKEKSPTIIHEDNVACVTQTKEGYIKSDRTKHIPPRYFTYTQDLIKENQIEMKYVQSSDNSADLFTKSLPTSVFRKHVHAIGMRHNVSSYISWTSYIVWTSDSCLHEGHATIPGIPASNDLWQSKVVVKKRKRIKTIGAAAQVQPPDPIAVQLAAIAKKLESINALQKDVAALKSQSQNRSSGNGSGKQDKGDSHQRYRPHNKISFPTFSDGDPRGWILKAEKYFRYYDIPEEEKVDVASMHLEEDALDFYSWASTNQTQEYWEDLVCALQRNFGPTEFQNPDEHLCSIKQTGTVQEYRQEFAKRTSRVSNWPEHCLLGVFLNGLKEELKVDVRIQKPRTVYKAVSVALEFEYGEKYGPGHRCKTGTLKVLEVEEELEEQPNNEVEYIAGEPNEVAEISLHATLGKPHPRTMKVQGILQSTEVIILIDGGSTHNFISDVLVKYLKLTTQAVAPFGVQIGNGDFIRCGYICKNLAIQIDNLKIVQDCYPFSIGGADLVLGRQWMETLDTVQANWKEMFMNFNVE